MKKAVKYGIIAVVVVLLIVIVAFVGVYYTRIETMNSIQKITSYDDGYNIYRMDVKYDYSIDNIINYGITDDQSMVDAITKECIPLIPVHIKAPEFGCTAFTMHDTGNGTMMGRSYDFALDTSAMIVHCKPKNGYESVAFAALDNVSANNIDSLESKFAALTAPFICLDGINEKGVSIAVLTLDSKQTNQNTGKEKIFTSLAIRLVLDRCATTQEAYELLQKYDMYASSGRDYHFYVTDASGDGRIFEYDLKDPGRKLTVTKTDVATNFYVMYEEYVEPYKKNEYGHGKERYDAAKDVLGLNNSTETHDNNEKLAWDALKAVAQDPKPGDPTSNTQWSIVYNNKDLTAHVALRRNWDDVYLYDLEENSLVKRVVTE